MVAVLVLKYIQTFFDNSPLRRWSLIILPLNAGQNYHLLSNQEYAVEVMVCSIVAFSLLFLLTCHSGESQAPYCEDIQAAHGDAHMKN